MKIFEVRKDQFKPEACRRNAECFGQERFQHEFRATVEELWRRFQHGDDRSPLFVPYPMKVLLPIVAPSPTPHLRC